jgi:hypothetical protein
VSGLASSYRCLDTAPQIRGPPSLKTTNPFSLSPLADHREHPILRTSFLIKLFFIILEFGLCIAFGVFQRNKRHNVAAIIEWVIACVFSFYVFSFTVDLWPAVHTKQVVVVAGRDRRGGRFRILGWVSRKRTSAGPVEMEEARITAPETERAASWAH